MIEPYDMDLGKADSWMPNPIRHILGSLDIGTLIEISVDLLSGLQ